MDLKPKSSIFTVVFTTIALLFSAASLGANEIDSAVLHPAIPLLDEDGNHVLDSNKAYSSRMSCGSSSCHDYEKITHAYHFEMGRDEADDRFGEKRGLPHLVSPGYFGGYACMGGNNPEVLAKKSNKNVAEFADRGTAGWVQRCASCHAGGGWMEKDRNGNRLDETDPSTVAFLDGDYFNRGTDEHNHATSSSVVSQWDWKKSGVVEADCMMCHADFTNLLPHEGSPEGSSPTSQFSTLRRSKLISGGHFRFAGSAMFEFLNLNNTDDETRDHRVLSFEKTEASEDDHHSHAYGAAFSYDLALENGTPKINWNADAFDTNKKIQIPMLKFPGNDSCMTCHRTSNSRRGFYGFGESALVEVDDEAGGTLIDDYQDDVHKGKTWTETNGQVRKIENCNTCHSQNYYNPEFANVDLNADHNFPKGNSDMDVRNDLDYAPNAKSCEYCHDESPNKAIPSGHDSMLTAHLERWKLAGDMAGYAQSSLERITQTHLDVVSCQACHITDKKSRGQPLQLSYRYRQAEDGQLKIIPYNPRMRAYWKDATSGYVLNKTERDSVFEQSTDGEGNTVGLIKHPVTGEVLGQVSTRFSHGSLRFNDPDTVDGIKALKAAYDGVLVKRGLMNSNAVMVWTESNEYVISHNTRTAEASVQCEDCHARKQSGAFSSLVSEEGMLGSDNTRTVTELPDRSLVDEGIVVLDLDYMKVQDSGEVTQTVSDILFSTKVDPYMTILKASSSTSWIGEIKTHESVDDVIAQLNIDESAQGLLKGEYINREVLMFNQTLGNHTLRNVALLIDGVHTQYADYRYEMELDGKGLRESAVAADKGALKSDVVSINAKSMKGVNVSQVEQTGVLLKLPYNGDAISPADIAVLHSEDGSTWSAINADYPLAIKAQGADTDGYVLTRMEKFGHYVVVDPALSSTNDGSRSTGGSSSSSGGAMGIWLMLMVLMLALPASISAPVQVLKRRQKTA